MVKTTSLSAKYFAYLFNSNTVLKKDWQQSPILYFLSSLLAGVDLAFLWTGCYCRSRSGHLGE